MFRIMELDCTEDDIFDKGNGLIGMKERLEFVNGNFEVLSENGTTRSLLEYRM